MATQQHGSEQHTAAEQGSSGGNQSLERSRETSTPARQSSGASAQSRGRPQDVGPFALMRRLSEDMDRMFGGFFGPNLSRWGAWPRQPAGQSGPTETFWPEIEVHQKGDKLVIQADVPGMNKDDVSVELRGNELCISGERRSESEREEGGYYRSERTYGSFCRTIPLPEGAKPETASASFDHGVLRVELEAPDTQARGRKLEVREGRPH